MHVHVDVRIWGGEGGGGRVSYLSTSGEFVQPEGQSDDQLYDKRKETCD